MAIQICNTDSFIKTIISGNVTALEEAINNGADVNRRCMPDNNFVANELTPLHIAAKYGSAAIISALIKHGANTNVIYEINIADDQLCVGLENQRCWENSKKGNTPLHIAAYYKNIDALKILMQHGADVNQMNKDNQTPLDIIKANNLDISFTADNGAISLCGENEACDNNAP